jgi:hypothetical protein
MPGGPEWSFVSVEMRGLHIRCGWPVDPLHAMQFRAGPLPQVRGGCPAQRAPGSDRDCPLVTAGDRCLWHAGGTADENDHLAPGGDGF